VDIDSDNAIATLMTLFDFVFNPSATRSLRSNEDDCNGSVFQSFIDHASDGSIALLFDTFPERVIPITCCVVTAFCRGMVADSVDTKDVLLVVKTEKDASRHDSVTKIVVTY
jgi:hypothetical protein